MGKKVKKKGRVPQKEKRVVTHSPSKVPHQTSISSSADNAGADGVVVLQQRRGCVHLESGFDLAQFSEKINSSDVIKCEDCRDAVADKRGAKGKGKHGKKKGADSKPIWICLKCGHYACGGVGLPTNSQCHAIQHAKQNYHPLAIQLKTHLSFCFKCSSPIQGEKGEDDGENKDSISDAVKVIKGHSARRPSVQFEDLLFGTGSVLSEVKAAATVSCSSEDNGSYMVRGLVNLGNTCFFNSIMQNLLAMNSLRIYFFSEDPSFGPLSVSLRKLYDETRQEIGRKNVINPRSFFGCLCSKAPQFRGFQQHDSHELLRCLLDAWSTEELVGRKRISASEQSAVSLPPVPTFVDAAFGGRISSTVCCIECAHSSTVYEPYLDLSLPVPTKKPQTKKLQSLSRAKKTKLPPKRVGKIRQKISKGTDPSHAESAASSSTSNELGGQTLLTTPPTDNAASSSGCAPVSYPACQTPEPEEKDSFSENFPDDPHHVQKEEVGATLEQTSDDFSWMDYLKPETTSNVKDLTSQVHDLSIIQFSEEKEAISNGNEESRPFDLIHQTSNPEPEFSVNPWEEEVPLQVQSSEVLLLPYYEESITSGEIVAGEAEASSSVVGCEPDESAFDGLGGLFDEPEVFIGPVAGPALRNGETETGIATAGNSSESDPGEVDDSDSPVSVESCLAHFIKPELLSNDNAWECENCSRTLRVREREAKKKLGRTVSGALNGGESQSQNLDTSCSSETGSATNGEAVPDALCNSKGENIVPVGGEIDCLNETGIIAENGQVDQQKSVGPPFAGPLVRQPISVREESGNQESSSDSTVNRGVDDSIPTHTGHAAADEQEKDLQSSTNVGSEESEDEETTNKKVLVKRDATKRVLIDKAPPILTIHLKRFSQDFRGRLSKLNGHVNFRDLLDLRPYMDPRCEDRERSLYRLTGVVEHQGTMRGGHYVAYIRGGERSKKSAEEEEKNSGGGWVWYHVSDAYVREASLDEVLRCEAYILFYERV